MTPTATPDKKPTAQQGLKVLSQTIESRQENFAQVATRYLTSERLVKLAQVVVAKNPKIAACTTLSILECLMTCSKLGLEPNEPGGVWLVPYSNVLTTIIDYRGMLDVCRRSGEVASVHADIRREKDFWEYGIDTTAATMVKLQHRPADGERGKPVGAYFVAKLKNGECQATYLTVEQIEGYRGRSKASGNDSPWARDWDAMAKKTAVRRGVNLLPKSDDVQRLREALAKEDKDEGLGDVSTAIQQPRRLSEAKASPSAPPPEPELGADVVAAVVVRANPKEGDVLADVEMGDRSIHGVKDRDLIPYLQTAAEKGYALDLTVDSNIIIAAERVPE